MERMLALLYGTAAYLVFLGTILYAIGFVGGIVVPKSIDTGNANPLAGALLINLLLLNAFALQHSVMARQGFKRWWTRIVPEPVERSTFVLLASLVLILLFWQWRPLPGVVWQVTDPGGVAILWFGFAVGWGLVFLSTFIIDHFDLFGLRQVYLFARRRPYPEADFKVVSLYHRVRHPLYLGFIIAFWSHPTMTQGHLLFATITTAYILVAIRFEERDLVRQFGVAYRRYRERVPMLVPFAKGVAGAPRRAEPTAAERVADFRPRSKHQPQSGN